MFEISIRNYPFLKRSGSIETIRHSSIDRCWPTINYPFLKRSGSIETSFSAILNKLFLHSLSISEKKWLHWNNNEANSLMNKFILSISEKKWLHWNRVKIWVYIKSTINLSISEKKWLHWNLFNCFGAVADQHYPFLKRSGSIETVHYAVI